MEWPFNPCCVFRPAFESSLHYSILRSFCLVLVLWRVLLLSAFYLWRHHYLKKGSTGDGLFTLCGWDQFYLTLSYDLHHLILGYGHLQTYTKFTRLAYMFFLDMHAVQKAVRHVCNRYWVGTGKMMFPNAQDGKFPRFLGKNPFSGKWHSGTQTFVRFSNGQAVLYSKGIRELNHLAGVWPLFNHLNTELVWYSDTHCT